MSVEDIIKGDDHDIRLDRWFKRHYPGLQHALLEKQLRKGIIRLDGKKAKSSDRVQEGQKIAFPSIEGAEKSKNPRKMSLVEAGEIKKWVLYEDSRLIIINKPAGLAVQGGTKITVCVDDMLDALVKDGPRPKLTHRLDRDTSGALVLAKNAKVATGLMHLFSSRQIGKTYLALLNGTPLRMKDNINLPLLKKNNPLKESRDMRLGQETREYEVVGVDEEEGQRAETDYQIIDFLARKFSLAEVYPHTGRLHQIRVHMQAIGHPIVGDHKYGGGLTDAESIGVENKLHLHAWRVIIPPFMSGKKVDVYAPLSPHMQKSFKALGISIPKKSNA